MKIGRPPSARLIWHFDDGMDGMYIEIYSKKMEGIEPKL